MPNRINPPMKRVQAVTAYPPTHHAGREPQLQQLPAGDHAMLLGTENRDRLIVRLIFGPNTVH